MKILVGLGNPGSEYARNRHNVGFMALDAIARRHGLGPARRRFRSEAAEGRVGNERVLAIKPQTYMNESGRAVGEAARFFKVGVDDIIVLHDEIDLAPGKVRVKRGGGLAGHNGLKSIAAHLGPDFMRVRIGIGHPGHKERVHAHVLGDFAKADRDWLDPLIDAIADSADALVAGDEAAFMNALAGARAAHSGGGKTGNKTGNRAKDENAGQTGVKAEGRGGGKSRARGPSQSDLARAAAERRTDNVAPPQHGEGLAPQVPASPRTAADEPAGGPFAMLRRLLGSTGAGKRSARGSGEGSDNA